MGSAVAVQGRPQARRLTTDLAAGSMRTSSAAPEGRVMTDVPALIFDCDGVLADTERYGHLPAFNDTFAAFGVPVSWSDARLRAEGADRRRQGADGVVLLTPEFLAASTPSRPPRQEPCSPSGTGTRPPATPPWSPPGDARPARHRPHRRRGRGGRLALAVASTSAEPSVRAVLEHVVGADRAADFPVFAGDIVPAKKPDPAIYQLAVSLGVRADQAVVVEDSRNGMLAALGAGTRAW